MTQLISYVLFGILLGALTAIYMPMNSQVAKYAGSAIGANVLFYGIGFLMTVALVYSFGQSNSLSKFTTVPPHLFITGIISAAMVVGMTMLIPILGTRKTFILLIAGQILTSIIVGHFQWLGVPADPISSKKIIGAIFILIGVVVSVN